jgi:hypothetical protein
MPIPSDPVLEKLLEDRISLRVEINVLETSARNASQTAKLLAATERLKELDGQIDVRRKLSVGWRAETARKSI